jgi:hypothetical protein
MNIAKIRQEYERNGKELQHKKLQHPSDIFSEEFTTGISTICPLKSQDVRGNVARKAQGKVLFLRQIFLQMSLRQVLQQFAPFN